ncbi:MULTISPECIES: alcohol dehydrogenase catalytic domain-containing protein [unclassified Brenneria]|uniref:zinc-dependent alcohol dehydrogenase n=1 Tax=unclassified Brenneria TaxID=2634434 RepID=UPI0029C2B475|nr:MULTISPECIES: alcohol dehydrogenase catalytic domain-containing protein [unclassified Brenneria]MDX5628779.1 alcohol dehydrogenase catalytic domain-containing protein [Brenneria sp. L3-3Z]MDX5695918.1 alcohol dehydrogenase catalytic domain-containing protein [Brenneria sp. L4-2C]MEE3661208.1 alcohol dehydrogenase catalytic domain-containing protein [Brenneria sp. g21c3]
MHNNTMKALIKTKGEPFCMEVAQIPIPEIDATQCLIEVKACGICGTDHSLWHWNEAIAKSYPGMKFPMVFGHEFCGVIAEVGKEVKNWRVGDRVVVNPGLHCNACHYCAEGGHEVCDHRPFIGTTVFGAFAEYCAVRSENLLKLDDNISFNVGALLEPFCVSLNAIDRVKPDFGDTAVVMGPGAIGLLMVIILKSIGVQKIIVTGTDADGDRLTVAKNFGAHYVINASKTDAAAEVMELTNGQGAEVIYDMTGFFGAVPQAVQMAAKRGRIGVTGLPAKPSEIPMTTIAMREISIIGNRAYGNSTWFKALNMLATGQVKIDDVASFVFPLNDFEQAMKLLDEKKGLRIILEP